jgi:ABC-type dipeptide/oligopeptide/nickel transport system ATPase component
MPKTRATEYPHQFSGGMQQRAMIAMGLALEPELVVADEPTTALDVTVQAKVLQLLREIRDTHGTAILFVTHDLRVDSQLCDWVYVIYAGRIVEEGPRRELFAHPRHPYTQLLLRATPTLRNAREDLVGIPEPFLTGLEELIQPAIVQAMPSLRQSTAMVFSPRKPLSTMRIFSSAENLRSVEVSPSQR